LDAGADDLIEEEAGFGIYSPVQVFEKVQKALELEGIAYERAELIRIPQNTVSVGGRDAQQVLTLLEMLEDQDDVQRVYSNFEMDDEEMALLTA